MHVNTQNLICASFIFKIEKMIVSVTFIPDGDFHTHFSDSRSEVSIDVNGSNVWKGNRGGSLSKTNAMEIIRDKIELIKTNNHGQ